MLSSYIDSLSIKNKPNTFSGEGRSGAKIYQSLLHVIWLIELLDNLNNLLIFKNGEEHLNDPVMSEPEVEVIM